MQVFFRGGDAAVAESVFDHLQVSATGEEPRGMRVTQVMSAHRSRGVAIAGRGLAPRRAWIPADVPLPERILLAETTMEGLGLTAVSSDVPLG
jgi:hypothetical protein